VEVWLAVPVVVIDVISTTAVVVGVGVVVVSSMTVKCTHTKGYSLIFCMKKWLGFELCSFCYGREFQASHFSL